MNDLLREAARLLVAAVELAGKQQKLLADAGELQTAAEYEELQKQYEKLVKTADT